MPNQTPPAFPQLSRNIDDIRNSLYAYIDSVQNAFVVHGWLPQRLNLNKGVVRGFIEIFAWGIWQVYNLLQKLLQQAVPHYSNGEWLDLHAQSVGLTRKPALKAVGTVRFIRRSDSSGNIRIPAGRIVRTLPDGTGTALRYVTAETAVVSADTLFVEVQVESEEYGAAVNAGTGQICELATPVTDIENITNTAEWLINEGADNETDASLINRISLRWMANNGCTKHAYKLWALSVPGVLSVEILDKHPRGQGTVGIVVRGTAVLPTAALLARVREAIHPQAPINDEWFVVSPTPVPVTVSGCLHYVVGDPDILIQQAKQRILALFADVSSFVEITPLAIGQDIPLDLLTATVMNVAGVKSISWAEPVANVVVPKDGMALLAHLNFSTFREEEA